MLGIISIIGTIIIWIYLIVIWRSVPHQVPTHFGISGNPDSWGGKGSLLILPIIETVLYLLLNITSKFPQYFNYISSITEENAERQYQNARTLISWLLTELTVIFIFLEWQSIQIAMSKSIGLGIWFLPVFLMIMFGTIGVYINRMIQLK